MGDQNWFGILREMLIKILIEKISSINEDSIRYEEVNYQAFNICFEVESILYRFSIELDSGINMHLMHNNGYLKSGEQAFITDSIMNKNLHKEIRKIKRRTIFSYEKRLIKMAELICTKINEKTIKI